MIPQKASEIHTGAGKSSVDLLGVVDEVERVDCVDHLAMAAVFGSVLLTDGQRNGENAQTGVDVGRVGFDVVDFQPEGTHGGDETLEVLAVFQLQVNLKVIRAVLQVDFKRREQCQTAHQRGIADDGHGIQSRADGQTDDAAGPERDGGRQTLNLVLGAVKDGVAADDGDGDDRRSGNDLRVGRGEALIQHHRHR